MDCKLINRQALATNRWLQDDTPCFVPFPNQSLKYWITTLMLAMMSIVGAWGQTDEDKDKTIDVKNVWSDYYYTEKKLTKGEVYNIKIDNRSFAKNSWQFLSLPFEATKSILDDAFGEGNYELQEFDQLDGVTFKFKKMATPSMTTAKPYVIKMLNNAVENPVFKNVTLTANSQADEVQLGNASTVIIRSALLTYDGNTIINQNDSKPYYPLFEGNLVEAGWYGDGIRNLISVSGAYARSMDGTSVPVLSLEGAGGGGNDDPSTMTLQQKIEARMQLTDVPTVYIDLPDRNGVALNTYLYKNRNLNEAPYRNAIIQVVDESEVGTPQHLESFTDTELEIKVRGNSTADADKKPYRLRFKSKKTSSDGVAHKHDLLGLGYSKRNWVLLANYYDRSLIRNAITYHVGKLVGMDFCPGYKFVDLVIDNEYRGTYQVSDQVEADKNRVAVTDEDNDWMLETVSWDIMMEEPCVNAGNYTTASNEQFNTPYKINIKNPDADDLTTDQITELKDAVAKWSVAWNNSFVNGDWADYNDVESLVKFYVGMNITGDWDGFFVMKGWRQPTGVFHWGPLWDKDLAYGNCQFSDDKKLVEYYENGQFRWNFINYLSKNATFVKAAKTLMDKLVNEDHIADELVSKVASIAASIDGSQQLNYGPDSPWNLNDQIGSGVFTYTDYSEHINKLKEWIPARINFVKGEIDKMYNDIYQNKVTLSYNPTVSIAESEGYVDLWSNYNKIADVTIAPAEAITGTAWSTLFLPFNVSEAEMTAVIGQYDLREYSGVTGSTFNFSTPASLDIKANKPYLIKLKNESGATSTSLAFTNVAIDSKTNNSVEFDTDGYKLVCVYHAFGANDDGGQYAFDDSQTGNLTAIPRNTNINGLHFYIKAPLGTTPNISIEGEVVPVVRTQLTTLPTIYIDTQDKAEVQSSAGEWVAAGIQVIDAKGNLKPFTQEIGLTSAGKNILQIRGRGTTSWTNTNKKSYRLQFGKDEKDEQGNVTTSYKHNFMVNEDGAGVVKKRNWVLLANAGDKTLVRNALTKEIGDAVGLPFTPGYRFVDLVLNGTYVGTYQVTEFLEADANRVNIDEDKGLLIQMTGKTDADLTNDHVISGEDYTKPYLTIKNPEVKKNQDTWNAAFNSEVYDFEGMWKANDGTGLNKESLVNWYIASEIIGDYEALSSIYAYKDKNASELSFGPLWGTETAYDNNASSDMTSTGLMSDEDDNKTHNGLLIGNNASKASAWKTKIEGLWAQPWFANAVRLRWNTLYNNGALTTTLKNKVTTLAGIVNATDGTFTTSSQAKNFTATADGGAGWSIEGQGITSYSKNVANNATYETEIARLKAYIDTRLPYLDKKFKALDKTIEYDVTRSDAKTYYAGYNTLTTNVILKNRGTITSSYWNPITFPFNANEDKMKEVFGNEFQLEQFSSVESQGDKVSVLKFTEVSPKAVTAGTPYLIKPASDVNLDEKTFSNVTFNSSDEGSTTATDEGYAYVGLLQPKTFSTDKTHLFVGKNNTFVRLSGSATLTGARAYFTIPEAAYSKKFNLGSFDDITGISNVIIQTDADNSKIYNLNGQMVGTNWNTLPQGVYIVNGKKIVK